MAEQWFNETKAAIFKQSDQTPDSIRISFNADSTHKTETPFFKGLPLYLREFEQNRLRNEIYYSRDGRFSLHRAVCINGKVSFEAILVDRKMTGPCVWYDCNGRIIQQGIIINSDSIGIWKKLNSATGITDSVDHGNLSKLDDLPVLRTP